MTLSYYCSRCGREQKKESTPMAVIMEAHVKKAEIILAGVCGICFEDESNLTYLAIPKEERDFGGWFMDMETDDERTWFIRKRIELYGS